MNDWMNNSRQDDFDFMTNTPAYNCCVCQHLGHVHKLDTSGAQTMWGWITEWAWMTQEVKKPWSPSRRLKLLPQ